MKSFLRVLLIAIITFNLLGCTPENQEEQSKKRVKQALKRMNWDDDYWKIRDLHEQIEKLKAENILLRSENERLRKQ